MVPLLAVLAIQVALRPPWAVTEFRDLKAPGSAFGRAAAKDATAELSKDGRHEVAPQEAVERSIASLGFSNPLKLIDLTRVGQDLRASTIVQGEVIDDRLDAGGPARAAVRIVAYDVVSGLPVGGALGFGVADLHGTIKGKALVQEAIGRAVSAAAEAIRRQTLPTATVVNTTTQHVTIDRGSRSGFKSGDFVIITRGWMPMNSGRVGNIGLDSAEVSLERGSVAPGDRVRAVFAPPPLPSAGTSILDKKP